MAVIDTTKSGLGRGVGRGVSSIGKVRARVVNELEELQGRHDRLTEFFSTDTFGVWMIMLGV